MGRAAGSIPAHSIDPGARLGCSWHTGGENRDKTETSREVLEPIHVMSHSHFLHLQLFLFKSGVFLPVHKNEGKAQPAKNSALCS